MELCDYYLKYMNALCEGTLAAPSGIALSGETPEERAMSLQAALKNVSVPDFVRRCARAAGDALPDGLLDGFHEEDFARALFARMALGGAPQPEEPPAPAGEADEPAPDPDAGKHAFEVFCDCLMLDENLIAYLIDVLKANDRAGFYKLSQVTTHLDLDPDEFLYWLAHREDYPETDEERACAVILDTCLDRLRAEGQMEVAAALLSGDRMTFDALRCEAPELRQLPVATYVWFEKNYLDRDYPLRFVLRCNGVQFPDTLKKEP